eukprot:2310840-Amphidinium_carterae.1
MKWEKIKTVLRWVRMGLVRRKQCSMGNSLWTCVFFRKARARSTDLTQTDATKAVTILAVRRIQ